MLAHRITIPWSPGAGFPGPGPYSDPCECKKWDEPNWKKWGYESAWDCAYDLFGEGLGLPRTICLIGFCFVPHPAISPVSGGMGITILLYAHSWCSKRECLEWG